MHIFNNKRLLVVFLVVVPFIHLFSQERKSAIDSNLVKQDTLIVDTLLNLKHNSSKAIDQQVTYSCVGMKKNDMVNKVITLVDQAVVTYGNIEIKADSIVFSMKSNTVYAVGRRDTTGKIKGTPVFKEGSQEYECDSMTYNFVTKEGVAHIIVTKQEEGILRSKVTKLLEDGTSNISRSTYSTCDAEHPHFYINLPKARVYPGKKLVSGPGNLVLEGIPLPLAIPFGFFPINTKKAASGILIPKVGQEQARGYNLTDGGYYFAINDYFDLALKGSIYTNGTWLLSATTNYNKLYKYSGQFSFNYANNISGHKGLKDYQKNSNYKIGWTYNQNAKATPGSRFAASVNMSSSGYDKTNSYTVAEHVTTQRQSSVSYSKTWEGTPFNLSASMNHSQNVKNKTVFVNLPKVSFNASRIYPLKSKKDTGPTKWYQELQFQYSASLDNQINTYDSLLFTKNSLNKMRSGFKHQAPLSIQFRPFKNFSISPSVTYNGVLYTQKYEKKWDPNYFNSEENKIVPSIVTDTLRGLYYGHAFNPSISAGYSPQIFGFFEFTKPGSRIEAIRHVIKPTVSFSYVPAFKGLSSDMYRRVQSDTQGNTTEYSIFEGSEFGTPSLSSRSGSISLGLVNMLEAKVFAKNDTTGKPKKVKLIDNFGINTSYNIFADSMRWSPVTMAVRTTLLNNLGISASSSYSLYGMDKNGKAINTFYFSQTNKLLRLTSFNVSLDFDLAELLRGDKDKKKAVTSPQAGRQSPSGPETQTREGDENTATNRQEALAFDDYGYAIFDVPWTMRVSYNLNYSKPAFVSNLTQTFSVVGTVTLTKKMAVTYTSGYDFIGKEITMTQIGITRDLHCWNMSFNWVPNGSMKMWNFTIRVKAAVLSDLKYDRRKDYHDDY